jgi:hypothetical protein
MCYVSLTAFLLMVLIAPCRTIFSNSYEIGGGGNSGQSTSQNTEMSAADRYERWKQATLGAMSGGTAHPHKYASVITQRLDDEKGIVKVAISGTNTTGLSYSVKTVRVETMPDGQRSQKDAGGENRVVTGLTPEALGEQSMIFKAGPGANAVQMTITFTDNDGTNCTMTLLLDLDAAEHMSIGAAIA